MLTEMVATLPLLMLMVINWSFFYFFLGLVERLRDFSVVVLLVVLAVASLVTAIPAVAHFRFSPFGGAKATPILRLGLLTAPVIEIVARVVTFYCVRRLPAGDAVTLINLCIVWTSLSCSALRRRWPSKVAAIAVALILFGAVLIKKPAFIFDAGVVDEAGFPQRNIYFFLALVDSFLNAAWIMLYNGLQKAGAHFSVFLFNYSALLLTTAAAAVGVASGDVVVFFSGVAWTPILGVALVGVYDFLSRLCAILALERVEGDVAAMFTALEIPITYALAYFFLGQTPDWLGCLGAAMIFAALTIVTVNDAIDSGS